MIAVKSLKSHILTAREKALTTNYFDVSSNLRRKY